MKVTDTVHPLEYLGALNDIRTMLHMKKYESQGIPIIYDWKIIKKEHSQKVIVIMEAVSCTL